MNEPRDSIPPPFVKHTPPTHAALLPAVPRAWPTVIGVIGVIYGSLMLVCNCGGVFTLRIFRWLNDFAVRSGEPDLVLQIQVRVLERIQALFIVHSVLAMAASAWLLIASIGLIRLRAWARRGLIAWATAELCLILSSLTLQAVLTGMTVRILQRESPDEDAAMVWVESALTMAATVLFSVVLPVFLLVWFYRARIRQEVAAWG
jgi:hypothetical protein